MVVGRIIGHVEVQIAVVLDIQKSGPHCAALGNIDRCLLAGLGEAAGPIIEVQQVRLMGEGHGAHHDCLAMVIRAKITVLFGIEVDVVPNEEIQITVTIHVAEDRCRRVTFMLESKVLCGLGERPIAVVVIEDIGAVIAHKNIQPAVVVDVTEYRAHSYTAIPHTRLGGDVREDAAVVAKKRVAPRGIDLPHVRLAIHEVNVVVTIIVVVTHGHA